MPFLRPAFRERRASILMSKRRILFLIPTKMSVMKTIACGAIKEHIKTHEGFQSYEELRNEMLMIAMFNMAENIKKIQSILWDAYV